MPKAPSKCGCSPECAATTKSKFAQGHDARMVKRLVAEVADPANPLTTEEAADQVRKAGGTELLVGKLVAAAIRAESGLSKVARTATRKPAAQVANATPAAPKAPKPARVPSAPKAPKLPTASETAADLIARIDTATGLAASLALANATVAPVPAEAPADLPTSVVHGKRSYRVTNVQRLASGEWTVSHNVRGGICVHNAQGNCLD